MKKVEVRYDYPDDVVSEKLDRLAEESHGKLWMNEQREGIGEMFCFRTYVFDTQILADRFELKSKIMIEWWHDNIYHRNELNNMPNGDDEK